MYVYVCTRRTFNRTVVLRRSSRFFDNVRRCRYLKISRKSGGRGKGKRLCFETNRAFLFSFFFFSFLRSHLGKNVFFFFERDSLVNKKRSSKTLFSIRLDTWYPFRFSSVSFRSQPRRAATRARDKHTRVCTNVRRHTVSKMFSSLYMLHMYIYIYIYI